MRKWKGQMPPRARKYRGSDNPKAKKSPLTCREVKLEPYKRPQKRGGKKSTRRVKTARWVPA